MNKADIYLRETLLEILEDGQVDKEPRPKWGDGSPAHSKFITQKVFQYDISKGEFPITTLRPTALKGAWYDIQAIYLKQTNVLEDMHKSIHSWWKDFVIKTKIKKLYRNSNSFFTDGTDEYEEVVEEQSLGNTYGHTIKRYNLMNKLLKGLEKNPFGRRHIISMWQEQQMIDDPQALTPCAYETLWSVREENDHFFETKSRFIDITLVQRSQDYCMTASINPAQYTMLAMMVCNHLTYKTGIKHEVGKLLHIVQNCHVYLRHMEAVNELLDRRPTGKQPKIELICEPKDFYSHSIEDFKFTGLENIEKLTTKLEIAV
jgi:thymidylate synthase